MKKNGLPSYESKKVDVLIYVIVVFMQRKQFHQQTEISSRVVNRAGGGELLKTLCIKLGYCQPTPAESREGSSGLAESSQVT